MQMMAAPIVPILIAWPVIYLGALLKVSRRHQCDVCCVLFVDICEGGYESRQVGDHDLVPCSCGSYEVRCLEQRQLGPPLNFTDWLTRLLDSQAITSGLHGKIPAATWRASARLEFVLSAPRSYQECSTILDQLSISGDEHYVPDNRHQASDDHVNATLLCAVRDPASEEDGEEAAYIWWNLAISARYEESVPPNLQ